MTLTRSGPTDDVVAVGVDSPSARLRDALDFRRVLSSQSVFSRSSFSGEENRLIAVDEHGLQIRRSFTHEEAPAGRDFEAAKRIRVAVHPRQEGKAHLSTTEGLGVVVAIGGRNITKIGRVALQDLLRPVGAPENADVNPGIDEARDYSSRPSAS